MSFFIICFQTQKVPQKQSLFFKSLLLRHLFFTQPFPKVTYSLSSLLFTFAITLYIFDATTNKATSSPCLLFNSDILVCVCVCVCVQPQGFQDLPLYFRLLFFCFLHFLFDFCSFIYKHFFFLIYYFNLIFFVCL